jgi:hypothetical protein
MKKIIYGLSILVILYGLLYSHGIYKWNMERKWINIICTTSVNESKERGVFVKNLKYKIVAKSNVKLNLKCYIERGFKFGKYSPSDTDKIGLNDEKPYQFNYEEQEGAYGIGTVNEVQYIYSDYYLQYPKLNDTLIFVIYKERAEDPLKFVSEIDSIGYIKVYN